MPGPFRFAVGGAFIALTIAIAGSGLILGPRPPVDVGTTPSPSPADSAAPSRSGVDTSVWLPFTSGRHGYSLRYPPGWIARAATRPWLYGATNDLDVVGSAAVDQFDAGKTSLLVASLALPAGVSELDWRADDSTSSPCSPPRQDWAPITIAELQGGLHGGLVDCESTEAAVVAAAASTSSPPMPTATP